MLPAPAHIPAITPSNLSTGFAAPQRIRDVLIDTFSAMISGRRVCSASPEHGHQPRVRHEIVLIKARGTNVESMRHSH